MDFGNALELIVKKLPGWMSWSLLVVTWMAMMSGSIHLAYIWVFAPGLRFLATHNFASIIHLSSKIWIDVLVMLGVMVFIFAASIFAAFLVIVFFLVYFVAPIFKAFQPKSKDGEESPAAEKRAPLGVLAKFPTLKKLDEA